MPTLFRCRPLHALAWLNVLVHFAGLVLAVAGMRPGSGLVPLSERLAYLAGRPVAWALGWGLWMLCALCLVAFLVALARAVPADAIRLAVVVAVSGAAVDLLCDLVQMVVLPALAASGAERPLFLAIERIAGAGGLVVANGAYLLATLLASLGLAHRPGVPRAVVPLGVAIFLCGTLLVVAGFTDQAFLAALGTGPTIGLYCVWVVLVARSVEAPA